MKKTLTILLIYFSSNLFAQNKQDSIDIVFVTKFFKDRKPKTVVNKLGKLDTLFTTHYFYNYIDRKTNDTIIYSPTLFKKYTSLMLKILDTTKFNTLNFKHHTFNDLTEFSQSDKNFYSNEEIYTITKFFTKHINDLGWEQYSVQYLSERNCATFPYQDFSNDIYKWAMRDSQITENEILLIGKYKVYALKDSLYKFFVEYEQKQNYGERISERDNIYHVVYALANLGDTVAEEMYIQQMQNLLSIGDKVPIVSPKAIEFYKDVLTRQFPALKNYLKTNPPCYHSEEKRKRGECGWPYSDKDEDDKMSSFRRFAQLLFCYSCGEKCKWLDFRKNPGSSIWLKENDEYDAYLLQNLEILQKQLK